MKFGSKSRQQLNGEFELINEQTFNSGELKAVPKFISYYRSSTREIPSVVFRLYPYDQETFEAFEELTTNNNAIVKLHIDVQRSETSDKGVHYCEQYDHIIKMAIIALRQTLANYNSINSVPLLLAMPDNGYKFDSIPNDLLVENLMQQSEFSFDKSKIISLSCGRAGGIIQLEVAGRYLHEFKEDYVVIGGSDSYCYGPLIATLDQSERLLTPENNNGFAPGEGAAFLLLTADPEKAQIFNGHIISMHSPGIGEESGNILSEQVYTGTGLDEAFKKALQGYTGAAVSAIISSMNGEHYWAKELGVAFIRNLQHIHTEFNHQHPADCYGDLGAASGPAQIILAVNHLHRQSEVDSYLVYSSSDSAWRASVIVEKIEFSS